MFRSTAGQEVKHILFLFGQTQSIRDQVARTSIRCENGDTRSGFRQAKRFKVASLGQADSRLAIGNASCITVEHHGVILLTSAQRSTWYGASKAREVCSQVCKAD